MGLAWQPTFVRGTTLRAGAGTYYPAGNAIYELFAITAPGVAIIQSITNQSSVTPTYVPGPNVFLPMKQVTITQDFADNISGTLFNLDTRLRTTYIKQWSFAIQHDRTKTMIAEIDYIGTSRPGCPFVGMLTIVRYRIPWFAISRFDFTNNSTIFC